MSRKSSLGGKIRQGLLIVAAIASVFGLVRCSSGDDNGGGGTTNNNPPPGGGGGPTQFAYVIDGTNRIQPYRLEGDGSLAVIGASIATGTFPHHVNVDPAGRFVYVSNHDSTFLSGWRINQDGSLTPMNPAAGSPVTGLGVPPDPAENQSHSSVLDQTGQFLYVVAGTGPSTLRAYRIDTTPGNTLGNLTLIGQSIPVGNHAHNITLSPNNQFIYLANQNSAPLGEVRAFSRNTTTGELTPAGTVTGLNNTTAVTTDPQSRFLFACSSNQVDVFTIAADGSLTRILPVSTFPTNNAGLGNTPHALVMHPNGQFLYVANLFSNTISVFRVDGTTGALTEIQAPIATGTEPNYIIIHPNQQFLFTADAGGTADQLSRFTINADGTLTAAGIVEAADGTNGIGTTKF